MHIIKDSTKELGIRHHFVDTLFFTHKEYINYIRNLSEADEIYGFNAREFFWHSWVPLRSDLKDDTLAYYGVGFILQGEDDRYQIPYIDPNYLGKFARLGHNISLLEYSSFHGFKEEFKYKFSIYYLNHFMVSKTLLGMENFMKHYPDHYLIDDVVQADSAMWDYFTSRNHIIQYVRPSPGNYDLPNGFNEFSNDYFNVKLETENYERKKQLDCFSDRITKPFRSQYNLHETSPQTFFDFLDGRVDSCRVF
jgi:hypothetical protein